MSVINVNTVKLEANGKKIISLSKQYKTLLNDFYTNFYRKLNMSWNGDSANNYLANLKLDKEMYDRMYDCLYAFGNELVNESNVLKSKISKWENN